MEKDILYKNKENGLDELIKEIDNLSNKDIKRLKKKYKRELKKSNKVSNFSFIPPINS